MKYLLFLLIGISLYSSTSYPSSESCNECHENIYREHTASMHHNSSLFKDEVHAKVKEATSKDSYKCAICHMPAATNLRSIMSGEKQPDANDYRQTDGVSCFYCHQISKIYDSKAHKINFSNYKGDNKPVVFGNLKKPYESNEHESQDNEIYKNSEVCMGCHSHKQNAKGFEVCNTKNQYDKTSDCIGCHMTRTAGTVDKQNKGMRKDYASHNFLGVHSEEMVKKAVKLELSYKDSVLELTINNRMGHSIITHPMRLKFVKTTITRDKQVIWSNFNESPIEDTEASFIILFKDADGKTSMPSDAVEYKLNRNLKASQTKIIKYKVPKLQKGDEIKSVWISYIVNPKIAKKLDIKSANIVKPYMGDEVSLYIY